MLLVEFDDVRDKQKILRGGPWSFDNSLVLLKQLEGALQVSKVCLFEASFWIRMYNMPFNPMNEKVGRLVREQIGIVEEVKGVPDGVV